MKTIDPDAAFVIVQLRNKRLNSISFFQVISMNTLTIVYQNTNNVPGEIFVRL